MVNDTVARNLTYRAGLMAQVTARGGQVRSLGLFEGGRLRVGTLLWLAIHWRRPVIASNLRSNLCVLMLVHLRGMVILNGLGRYRSSPWLRLLLIVLITINWRKTVLVQNFADYRYLRRFSAGGRVHWIPGSGGVARAIGEADCAVVVQRDDKIDLVAPSLRRFLAARASQKTVSVMGCSSLPDALRGMDIQAAGHVAQDALFARGRIFLQPAGYGEGIPHSLVDAILSGMEIWIDRRLFRQTGLARLGARLDGDHGMWGQLRYCREDLGRHLGEEVIITRQLEVFSRFLAGRPPLGEALRRPDPPQPVVKI